MNVDELATKISELNKKLGIAMRMGNHDLCNQIRMALENHQTKYYEKTQELLQKQNKGRGTNFDEIIDIS
jgi:predicted MPP superfamily phosphohydrolase